MRGINRARGVLLLLMLVVVSACSDARANTGVELELGSQGDQLAFSTTTLTARAGEPVTVVFTNNAKALQHNWVLVQGDDQVANQVSEQALTAGPDQNALLANQPNIVAHTNLLPSGETASLTFTAPTLPGAYTYLCTFPGHYLMGMKGTLQIEP